MCAFKLASWTFEAVSSTSLWMSGRIEQMSWVTQHLDRLSHLTIASRTSCDQPGNSSQAKLSYGSCHASVLLKSTHISMFEPYPSQRRRDSRVAAGIQSCRGCHNRAWGTLGISFRRFTVSAHPNDGRSMSFGN